jgi:hypothetical protein
MLAGHQLEIQANRDRKLAAAREQRKDRRERCVTNEADSFRFADDPPTTSSSLPTTPFLDNFRVADHLELVPIFLNRNAGPGELKNSPFIMKW